MYTARQQVQKDEKAKLRKSEKDKAKKETTEARKQIKVKDEEVMMTLQIAEDEVRGMEEQMTTLEKEVNTKVNEAVTTALKEANKKHSDALKEAKAGKRKRAEQEASGNDQ